MTTTPTVLHVCGARPNFMKVAPVLRALAARGIANALVDTGQHYDHAMSGTFFEELGLPEPDVRLGVGSGTHAEQTGRIMERIDPVLREMRPALTVVVGDVNSTIAAAMACAKQGLPVAHVEAGLRSFDRSMPEEINRVLTDQISDLLFTTSPEARANLVREGVADERIHFVGNPMIDSLEDHATRARASAVLDDLGLDARGYVLVTLHRPSNVDDPGRLEAILRALGEVARDLPVVFPLHPRTRGMIEGAGLAPLVALGGVPSPGTVRCVPPAGYVDFLRLMGDARLVLTDSGGVQEETTVLGVPCLTLRENTERPITIEAGTNRLIGAEPVAIVREARRALAAPPAPAGRPPLWDGHAGERIAEVIAGWLAGDVALERTPTPLRARAAIDRS